MTKHLKQEGLEQKGLVSGSGGPKSETSVGRLVPSGRGR